MTNEIENNFQMKSFKTHKKVDVENFIGILIDHHQEFEVSIGTDSQYIDGKIIYVTVVAFRFWRRGVVALYHKQIEKISKEISGKNRKMIKERLRKETEMSIDFALKLSRIIDVNSIDLDYNSDEKYMSYEVLKECVGYCVGCGFTVTVKPREQVAIHIADKLCKK